MKSVFILLGLSFLMNAPQMDAVEVNVEGEFNYDFIDDEVNAPAKDALELFLELYQQHVRDSEGSQGASIPDGEVKIPYCPPPGKIISSIGCVCPVIYSNSWDYAELNCRDSFSTSLILVNKASSKLPELQSAFNGTFDGATSVWIGPKIGDRCPYIDMAPTPPVIKYDTSCPISHVSLCLIYPFGSTAWGVGNGGDDRLSCPYPKEVRFLKPTSLPYPHPSP